MDPKYSRTPTNQSHIQMIRKIQLTREQINQKYHSPGFIPVDPNGNPLKPVDPNEAAYRKRPFLR